MTKKYKTRLDLNLVRDIIFQDIFKLLDSFELEYTQDADNIFMKCPIHEGSDNPVGVSISLDRQMWRCWTRGCHEHYKNDIWGFIKGVLGTESFSEALKYVCKIYNVKGASKNDRDSYGVDGDSDSCQQREFSQIVRQIKQTRTTTKEAIEVCDFAKPETTPAPCSYFISRGFGPETLNHFGVQSVKKDARGVLRHRSIIPIWDADGGYAGYIARATKDFIQPKYIFSKGIRKSEYLYNYHNAVGQDTLFVVEGQGDVWRLWECGVKNAVGLFGKDVSSQQRKLLLNSGATKLIILTDNDQAGRESKIKIKRDLGRLFTLVFPKMHNKDLGDMSVENIQTNILQNLRGYY